MSELELLLTREETANLLRVSLRTLDHLVNQGEIPAPVRLGERRLFFYRQQLMDWLQNKFGISTKAERTRTGSDITPVPTENEIPTTAARGKKIKSGRPRKPLLEPNPQSFNPSILLISCCAPLCGSQGKY